MKSAIALAVGTAGCVWGAFGVVPCLAQSPYGTYDNNPNSPQYSTPQEREQTRELNNQSINGTTQSPDVLNGESQQYPAYSGEPSNPGAPQFGTSPDQAAAPAQQPGQPANPAAEYYGNPQAASPYGPTPYSGTQYDGAQPYQQQQYDDRQQQYQSDEQTYQSQRARYEGDISAYDRAMYEWAYPGAIAYRYDGGLEPIYLIAEPSQQLSQIPVEGPGGRWVGRVRNVETAPDGRPGRVEVALNRRVSVWVQPGDLRYDPGDHVLFTDLSRAQLWQLPGATVESATY